MPEDRFGDLGAPDDDRTAAEKLAELDEREPEPDDPRRKPPEPPRPSGRYMWVVGVAAMILLTVVLIHQLGAGSGTFIRGPDVGKPLPEFAAPGVNGPDEPANVVPRSNKDSSQYTPACDIRVPGAIRICDWEDKPVVVSFLFLRGADCEPYFDRLERVHRKYAGRVNVIGVFFEKDFRRVREVVKDHRWTFPLAVDRDGAVTNLYAVGGCPTTVFAERGGIVRETRTGSLTEQEMDILFGRLLK